jgi:hypothetical protein
MPSRSGKLLRRRPLIGQGPWRRSALVELEQGGWSELDIVAKLEIDAFVRHACARRRVVMGGSIAHDEKVFSKFRTAYTGHGVTVHVRP